MMLGPGAGREVLFGRNRPEVHVCLGEDDPQVSRHQGTLTHRDGHWWVSNTGRLPIRCPAGRLLFRDEEPLPLDTGYTPVRRRFAGPRAPSGGLRHRRRGRPPATTARRRHPATPGLDPDRRRAARPGPALPAARTPPPAPDLAPDGRPTRRRTPGRGLDRQTRRAPRQRRTPAPVPRRRTRPDPGRGRRTGRQRPQRPPDPRPADVDDAGADGPGGDRRGVTCGDHSPVRPAAVSSLRNVRPRGRRASPASPGWG